MTHDDLTPWQETPFMQALASDGADGELDGEHAALAAFRKSSSRRGHVVRLLGTGVTSVALAGVVGGGVAAAAYTRTLPEPVQNALHDVLGPIGVPAPHAKKHAEQRSPEASGAKASPSSAVAGAPVVGSSPPPHSGVSTSAHPATPGTEPVGVNPLGSASPAVTPGASLAPQPSATPSATATPSVTPSAPAGDPSTWSLSVAASSQLVPVHADVDVSGTLLDASGQPVPGRRVVIRVHRPGTSGWERTAARRTDANGSVQAELDDLVQNTVVVLGAGHGVHSDPVRIVVRPGLSTSVTPAADGTSYLVTVTADGAQPGDVVNLLRQTHNGWEQVGQATLDGSASASFSVPAPKHQHGYVLRLAPTKLHGVSATRIVLRPLG